MSLGVTRLVMLVIPSASTAAMITTLVQLRVSF